MKAQIGDLLEEKGHLSIDIERLIETRLLVQANSGGGKSYLLRKLIESTHGKVQQIILDIEGEFASLRERFDFILAGKGGDIPADTKSAALLARKVMELSADIIIDLSELKYHDRIRFVRLFLESLIDLPQSLWHPAIVVVDEGHLFAPETTKAESLDAVVDLFTRGRKRGLCGVLATQRISKLKKDVAAECNNKLIGRTGLDIDVKRAGDDLGFKANDALKLRDLDPGEFYAFGPAISKKVVKVKIGSVETKHMRAGKRGLSHVPAATAKVKSVLAKLTDLPKEAEEELKDLSALRAKVKDLSAELKKKPDPSLSKEELESIKEKAYQKAKTEAGDAFKHALKRLRTGMDVAIADSVTELQAKFPVPKPEFMGGHSIHPVNRASASSTASPHSVNTLTRIVNPPKVDKNAGGEMGQCERRILGFLLMKSGQAFSRIQIAAMTGYRVTSGGFKNALSKLNTAGLIQKFGTNIELNPAAIDTVRDIVNGEAPHSLQDWISKLGACEKTIYEMMLANPGEAFPREEIAATTGYQPTSGGFKNALSRLNTIGLIKRHGDGRISLNPEVSEI